jgi:hypothetical protein
MDMKVWVPKLMRWVKWVWVLGLLGFACGAENDNEELCDQVRAKVAECRLNANVSGECREEASEAVLCGARCVANAECSQLTGAAANNPYYRCLALCSGAKADDFICNDGKGFLPKSGVCDGAAQCPDASDEAGCSR